ncbi:MAG: hypothetical protein ABI539_11380, partial [Acidobacteriota bacterium]
MTDEIVENTDAADKLPDGGGSIFQWLLPLLLLLLLIALGFWFFRRSEPRTPPSNTNNGDVNASRARQNTDAKT